MTSTDTNIYSNSKFKDIDVGKIMRHGHPDIEDGDQHIVKIICHWREKLGRPLSILDIGSGSGHLCLLLAKALPDCEVIANEIASTPAEQARKKLSEHPKASVFDCPFEDWKKEIDIAISWGSHHHFSHSYLQHIKSILSPDGLFLVGDELCPEYLTDTDKKRFDKATMLTIEGGYIFDNEKDLLAYKESAKVPEWNLQLEEERRRALWTWYKYVGDYAVEKGAWPVLISELQIARDDLITNFADEHKTSSYLLERELKLNGFSVIDQLMLGKDRKTELQSTSIFSCVVSR